MRPLLFAIVACAASASACAQSVDPVALTGSDASACDLANTTLHRVDLTGPGLSPEWDLHAVGTPPTFTVSNDWLTITDASLAATASVSDMRSWIYDPRVDRGNQMAWDQSIGVRDVEIAFALRWASRAEELTLAGVALTTADHELAIYAGFADPWGNRFGTPFVRVVTPTDVAAWQGEERGLGRAEFVITRRSGAVVALVDGEPVLRAESRESIAHVAIFAVRHRDAFATYEFGTVEVGALRVCD
jgi:hypothetical protein